MLADEQGYVTWIEDEADLAGLPDSVVAAMAAAAKERGKARQMGRHQHPFLDGSVPDLRRQSPASRTGLAKLLQPRRQRRRARQQRDHRRNPEAARRSRQAAGLRNARPLATRAANGQDARGGDGTDDEGLAQSRRRGSGKKSPTCRQSPTPKGTGITIEPWDYRYYAEKVRKAKYDLDFNEVKPYLQLEKLGEAMMWAAGELYGLQFRPINDVPVFHPDVRVWEVTDARRASTSGCGISIPTLAKANGAEPG